MRTARRFVNDESGMTMALAVIMVVVLGVMGAGLLAFATKDLDTVVEENRGQAAFGVADAGIEAAKRQLKSDCLGGNTCSDHYDGIGDDDLQWSATEGGLLLKDLDGDGAGGTPDNVNVKIRAIDSDSFRAISNGTLGATTRKIEAMFEGSGGEGGGGGGGGNVTFPGTWTRSNILVNGPHVKLNGTSMFTESNIVIAGVTTDPAGVHPNTWTDFLRDINSNNEGAFDNIAGATDALEHWYTPLLPIRGSWNKVWRRDLITNGPRAGQPKQGDLSSTKFTGTGFAAEGLVCGTATNIIAPNTDPNHLDQYDCDQPGDSVADGHIAYDSTTNSKFTWDLKPYGQGVKFARKLDANGNLDQNNPDQAANIISYPFPIEPKPNAERLKRAALKSGTYFRGVPTSSELDALIGDDHVAFVDAEGNDLTYNPGQGNRVGIIVVWCGNLHITESEDGHPTNFNGIVVSLKGDGGPLPVDPGSGLPATNCTGVDDEGTITTDHSNLNAWLYSNSTSVANPGIQINDSTSLGFVPNGNVKLIDTLLEDPIMTNIDYKGWRELYE
jgi:hypothetical protein